MTAVPVLNTKGAARQLGCSETWIHKLVAAGKLKAYIYDAEGVLVEHQQDQKRQGQGLYFLTDDLARYQPAVQRRPRGKKHTEPHHQTSPVKTA